ncbi:AraC family transcriptional regulator [Nocardia camponoti]|uniref:AraC family transcriptional regulator n=1 Tax=Nocardia camponoti TaxID=1616106 RepID=A0A917QU01_9NOCA|nr:helix-turn-helix domain-containing protein [Nocardia camponoti]GGK67853.1 AraC family transcriptional regulator [Nocardia camponoti]
MRFDPASDKGILHARVQAEHRSLARLPVGEALADVVSWYWIVRWDLRGRPAYHAEVLSYPCVNITFEQTSTRTGAFVNGVTTRKYVRELSDVGETFGILFRPGGFGAFTGVDVGSLRDTHAPLADVVPGAERLAEAVAAESDDGRRCDLVEEFFAGRSRVVDPHYALVSAIVRAMADDPELTRVDQVTEAFDVPVRTMQRLFRRYVGAGPKWVLRRFRLQDATDRLARDATPDLAALAFDLGYFDQAHFTREFTREIGCAPAEYARRARG